MLRSVPATLLFGLACVAAPRSQVPPQWTRPVPPVRVMGPVHYVGTEELSAFLITSAQGHILVDSGHERNADTVAGSIRALGFDVRDVKYLLTTQAHFDHVGAHARLKEMSGARVLAAAGDAPVMEGGGKGDVHLGPEYYFPPVAVDAIVNDGDVIRLGDIQLRAHLTPGHTRGATTWTMTVRGPDGRDLALAIVASTSVNDGVKLVNNPKYPEIAEDYRRTFASLEALPCEVFLAAHASAFGGIARKSFIDPSGCRAAIAASKRSFEAKLEAQQAAAKP